MVAEIVTGIGLFKSMFDTAKGLKDMNDAAVRNAAVIELQEKILSAQAQQMALIERVGDLEKEMARSETWESEKQRYRLVEIVPGAVAHLLKRSEAGDEPSHALCANCYDRSVKSILQSNGNPYRDKHAYVCPLCKTELKTGGQKIQDYAD